MVEGVAKRICGLWAGRESGKVPQTGEISFFEQTGSSAPYLEPLPEGGGNEYTGQLMAFLLLGRQGSEEKSVGLYET